MRNKRFEIEDEEWDKIDKWCEEQMIKDPTQFTAGERWEYRFIPTGLGTLISVRDGCTDDLLKVRGTENW